MTANIDQRIAQLDRKAGFRRWGKPVPFETKTFRHESGAAVTVECRLLFSVTGVTSHDGSEAELRRIATRYEANGGRFKSRYGSVFENGNVAVVNFFEFHDQMYQLSDGKFLFLINGVDVFIRTAEQVANEDFHLGNSESARKLYRLMGFFRPAGKFAIAHG